MDSIFTQDFETGIGTFVIPHYAKEFEQDKKYLDKALDSVFNQTDSNWQIVIIDDASPCKESVEYIKELEKNNEKIKGIYLTENGGPGVARNAGVEYAYETNSPIVLYLDSDDICHERRLEVVRKKMMEDKEINVVYSTFQVIDEYDEKVPYEEVAPAIQELLDGHKKDIVEGENAWIAIATEKNYTNLTSSTAVKTIIAYTTPFPGVKISEDMHAWLRYGARKGKFCYDASIPSCYRIPRGVVSKSRGILENFCKRKIKVDTDGFFEAMKIALDNKNIDISQKDDLTVRFYIKLAESMLFADSKELALELVEKAREISNELTEKYLKQKQLAL